MRAAIALLIMWLGVAGSASAATSGDVDLIKARFAEEKLAHASIELGSDGRLRLTGAFRDRAEVQLAFALAQQVVGVKAVAPTTPENVRYPGTEAIKSGILDALRRSKSAPTSGSAVSGERYALIVGVGHYADSRIPPIANARDDAQAFFEFLGARNVRRENIHLFLEDKATKQNVSRAMQDLRRRVKPEDTVTLYFSTHGDKPNDLGNVPIILYDTRVDTVRKWIDPRTTVVDDELKQFVEAVSPARVMVVLDICYSGAAFAKIPGVLASTSRDLFVEETTFTTGVSQQNLTYLAGSRQEQEKILIAASGPGEKSWNSPVLKHGYFTYYFVQELQGKGDVQSAFTAAKPIVQAEVRRNLLSEDPVRHKDVYQTPQATFIPHTANVRY